MPKRDVLCGIQRDAAGFTDNVLRVAHKRVMTGFDFYSMITMRTASVSKSAAIAAATAVRTEYR